MKCGNCQTEIDEKHRRCHNCGAPNPSYKDTATDDVAILKDTVKRLEGEINELKEKKKQTGGSGVL